jgi:hypothetical protein
MLKFTTPVKPFKDPIVTVWDPLELRFTVIVAEVVIVKSGAVAGSTCNVTETVRTRVPSEPVIVSG